MNDLFAFDVGDSTDQQDVSEFMTADGDTVPVASQSTVQSPVSAPSPAPFKKSKWTPDEDKLLIDSVNKHGMGNWSLVSQSVPGRTGKQCRERWINQLCPALNKDNWTPQEDAILIQQQRIHGNFWSKIAQFLPGRSSNNVKNRWSWLSRHRVPPSLAAQMMPFIVQQQQLQFQQFQQMRNFQFQQFQNAQHRQRHQMHQQINHMNTGIAPQQSAPSLQINQFASGSANAMQTHIPAPLNNNNDDNNDLELDWENTNRLKNRVAFSDPFSNLPQTSHLSPEPDSMISFGDDNLFDLYPEQNDNDPFQNNSLTDMPIQPPDDIFKPFDDWGSY